MIQLAGVSGNAGVPSFSIQEIVGCPAFRLYGLRLFDRRRGLQFASANRITAFVPISRKTRRAGGEFLRKVFTNSRGRQFSSK
jgi:hypothetical protein